MGAWPRAAQSDAQRKSEGKSGARRSLRDGSSVVTWVKRMSVEEKAATFVAAVEGGVPGEADSVALARKRLSIMSAAEKQRVLVEILDTTTPSTPSKRTRLSLNGPAGVTDGARSRDSHQSAAAPTEQPCTVEFDSVVPFEASRASRASWASLAFGDVEDDFARLDGTPAAATAARLSWKRCRLGVLVACYWQRCSAVHALARWKAALNAEQISRLERLYTLQVLGSRDSLARHERYFVVADKAALEVEKRTKLREAAAKPKRSGGMRLRSSTPAAAPGAKGDPRATRSRVLRRCVVAPGRGPAA